MPQISKKIILSVLALFLLVAAVAFAFASISSGSQSLAEEDPVDYYFLRLRSEDYTTYTDPVYGFSFRYPADFAVSNLFDDEGERYVALLEHSNPDLAIQIIVSPTEQDVPLTFADISPSVPVEHPTETELSDGTPALRFYSKDADGKDTGEIWFIHEGNLYQVSMYAGSWFNVWPQQFGQDLRFESL